MSFTNSELQRLPLYFCNKENEIENYTKDNIELSELDKNSFETSWDFQIHPLLQMKRFELERHGKTESSIERCFGLWKAYTDIRFRRLKITIHNLRVRARSTKKNKISYKIPLDKMKKAQRI